MRRYGGVDVYIHILFISELVGCESFTPWLLKTPGKEPRGHTG
jgi:hypothetical protein